MKAALYARVSTTDKDQNPETQLMVLRDYCKSNNLEVYREYIDKASALDARRRTAWRELLDDSAKRRFKAVLVFKLDRAFRSVKDMHDTLSVWEKLGIDFISAREKYDTTSALGRLLLNILASLAEFELELIRERVIAGINRAKVTGTKSGKHIGRPTVAEKHGDGFSARAKLVLARIIASEVSLGKGAKELGISKSSMKNMVDVLKIKNDGVQKRGIKY